MARYVFDLHDGVYRPDPVGSGHPDIAIIRTGAVEGLSETLWRRLSKGNDVSAWVMTLRAKRL